MSAVASSSSSSSSAAAGGISFRLTPEQRELQRLAQEFAARELRPIAAEWDARDDFPPDLLAKAAGVGLTSYAVPREYGGGGVDPITAALIAEELSWGCAGLAATIQATMFPVRPLLFAGTDQQRERYLPLLASEEGTLAAIAFTEPGAGSDFAAIGATARRDGNEFVLSGEKCYVTNGGIAAVTIVFARLDGEITAFVVERGDRGVSAGRKEEKLGLRSSYTGSVLLDEARIPADRILGEPGQGFAIAMDFFTASRPQVAAGAVGVARAAFEYAAEYARSRQAFGKPLLAKQAIAFKLADMAIEVEAARLLVWRACEALVAGEDAGLLGSFAKAFAADAAMRATTEAVQILGGAGVMRDHPVEKWMRDAKVFQIVEGTSEIQRHVIATYLRHTNR
jgi:alkylation response protein AidB-like acyl-CoA dehydrogenase